MATTVIKERLSQWDLPVAVRAQLQELFTYWTQNLGLDLRIEEFQGSQLVGGHALSSSAATVYAFFADRRHQTDTTSAYVKLYNDATNDGSSGDARTASVLGDGEYNLLVYPDGTRLGTGVVVTSHTSATGTSDSSSTERADGFAILG